MFDCADRVADRVGRERVGGNLPRCTRYDLLGRQLVGRDQAPYRGGAHTQTARRFLECQPTISRMIRIKRGKGMIVTRRADA
jgi:hypothetical protein